MDRLGQTVVAPLYDAIWQYSGELTPDTTKSALLIDMNEVASVGAYASDESIMEVNGELVWYRSMRTIEQSLDLLMRISGEEWLLKRIVTLALHEMCRTNQANMVSISRCTTRQVELSCDGLSEGPITTIFVDKQAPILQGIRTPDQLTIIPESDWSDLEIQLTVREMEQLNPDSLVLNYAIHPAGLGLNVAAKYDGQISMDTRWTRIW